MLVYDVDSDCEEGDGLLKGKKSKKSKKSSQKSIPK